MKLLIAGTLKGQLTAATKIAMDRGADRRPRAGCRGRRCAICGPGAAATS